MILKLFKMKRGTKVGWLLVAFAILLSLWVIISQSANADTTTTDGIVLNDDQTTVLGYTGTGGIIEASFFPASVTSIAENAFAGKDTISGITLPSGISSIGNGAFSGCVSLTNIAFSDTAVSTIPENAFANCTNLSSVSLPANITRIDANAFLNCGSLTSCELPPNAEIDPIAFKNCGSLSAYKISGTGSVYKEYGGNLYDAGFTRLLRVAPGISSLDASALYSGCTEIGTGAFSANQWIAEFTVPSTIGRILQNAFKGSSIASLSVSSANTQFEGLVMGQPTPQEDWTTLTAVYGPSDSPAEMFAVNHNVNGVMFYPIGSGDNDPTNPDNPNNPDTPDNPTPSPSPSPGTNGQGDINGGANSGTIVNNNITGGSSTVTNGGGSTTVVNGKDATPKTADGDLDIRWFAILGMFLAGISIVFFSRFRKAEYIAKNGSDSNDLDF